MKNLINKIKNNNKGFTLVELIIVIAIIAVLAVIIAPQYLRFVEDSRESADVNTANQIESAINVLVADGTLSSDGTVTWDVDGGSLALDAFASGTAADLYTQLNAAAGDAELIVTSDNAGTTDVEWTVAKNTATGNITVTCDTDYKNDWVD